MKKFDLAIVGAGPVGLFATHFAQLHGLKTITFEALEESGGQAQVLFPNKLIKDIPAFNSILSKELIKRLKSPIESPIHYQTKIEKLKQTSNNSFVLNDEFEAHAVLLTTGLGAFHPKKLPLKVESSSIHYFMTDPSAYREKNVIVLGGGDSALDWALQLAPFVHSLSLIHRRPEFRGLETSVKELKNLKNVKILTPYLPKHASIEDNAIELGLEEVGTKNPFSIKADDIFVAYGFKSDNRLLRKWGLSIDPEGIVVDRQMQTNIPGVFAAGDNASYPGKVPMIALGFGEAQIAITNIMANLFPEKKITLHSTSI